MSTQKGSGSRSRPQKYQNRMAFNNSLHDTSQRTKMINNLTVSHVCARCKEIIEWKIKYKKYKPLTQPAKCTKCGSKSIKRAYHTACADCSTKLGICAKCAKPKEIIATPASQNEQFKLDNEMTEMLKLLPERRRRTFLRYMNKNLVGGSKNKDNNEVSDEKEAKQDTEAIKKDLMDMLNSLKIDENADDDFLDDSDFDDDLDSHENDKETKGK